MGDARGDLEERFPLFRNQKLQALQVGTMFNSGDVGAAPRDRGGEGGGWGEYRFKRRWIRMILVWHRGGEGAGGRARGGLVEVRDHLGDF